MRTPTPGPVTPRCAGEKGTGRGGTIVRTCWLIRHGGHEGFVSWEPREEGRGVDEPGLGNTEFQDGAPRDPTQLSPLGF